MKLLKLLLRRAVSFQIKQGEIRGDFSDTRERKKVKQKKYFKNK